MKKFDKLWEFITYINVALVTMVFLFVLALFEKASPQRQTGFDRIFGVEIRRFWDRDLILYDYYLLVLLLILSIIAYYISLREEHTKKFSKYFLISGSISAFAIFFYLIFFIITFS